MGSSTSWHGTVPKVRHWCAQVAEQPLHVPGVPLRLPGHADAPGKVTGQARVPIGAAGSSRGPKCTLGHGQPAGSCLSGLHRFRAHIGWDWSMDFVNSRRNEWAAQGCVHAHGHYRMQTRMRSVDLLLGAGLRALS